MYGTWVSSCIAAAMAAPNWTGDPAGPLESTYTDAAGDVIPIPGFPNCPNQYWNGGPAGTSLAALINPTTGKPFGGWGGVALSPYGVWSDTSTNPALNTSGLNFYYAAYPLATTHFVIDTGRNGQGPWQFSPKYPDAATAQDWCNPPGRGLGFVPTTITGNALVAAYLWIKVPGESDGACTRDGSAGTQDPERGIVDPAAGDWFPQQALELAKLANPPLPL